MKNFNKFAKKNLGYSIEQLKEYDLSNDICEARLMCYALLRFTLKHTTTDIGKLFNRNASVINITTSGHKNRLKSDPEYLQSFVDLSTELLKVCEVSTKPHGRSKSIKIDGKNFDTMTEGSKFLGVSVGTLSNLKRFKQTEYKGHKIEWCE